MNFEKLKLNTIEECNKSLIKVNDGSSSQKTIELYIGIASEVCTIMIEKYHKEINKSK
ncbi:hypothetical protein SAMN05660297_02779 [Natronincola peptidivorans]|uniref:Uncharacterized protein n=1 Tax=Natronincola peptidivorans TaxID=426128 RepID=A0A1I0FEK2_9FIRM|nr:hypothetical protein [Natronincola peptidivorans]SET56344.1 hypothetical protein SAMN05660297_02779 [Natronincola peptidivorans]